MTTLKLDPTTHDLYLDGNGTVELVDGIDETAQRLKTKYRFFLGEWFLDQRLGVPLIRDVFVKNPNIRAVTAMLRQVAQQDPGVETVEEFLVDYDTTTRMLSVTAQFKNTANELFSVDFTELLLR